MNGSRIGRSLLQPEARFLSVSEPPKVWMAILALTGHEGPDMRGIQCRLVKCQRTLDVRYRQDQNRRRKLPAAKLSPDCEALKAVIRENGWRLPVQEKRLVCRSRVPGERTQPRTQPQTHLITRPPRGSETTGRSRRANSQFKLVSKLEGELERRLMSAHAAIFGFQSCRGRLGAARAARRV